MSLDDLRAALDAADDALLAALARRAALVREIWGWKQAHGLPRLDPDRERAIRARLVARGVDLGLSADALAAILDRVVGKPL
jgi:chorismate mutase